MDSVFVTAALDSIFKVLSTMANISPVAGTPEIKEDQKCKGAVTGVMNMASDNVKGALSLSFSEPVIFDIAHRMLGEECTGISESTIDLTGEIVNMVVGGAKAILAEKGYDFDMARPDVVVGEGKSIKLKYPGQTVILPFDTSAGRFYLELTYAD